MKKLFITLMIGGFCLNCFSQDVTVKLWPGAVPGESGAKHPPALYKTSDANVKRVSDITDPDLIVFKPTGKTIRHAAIIISPGGGNKYLAINLEGTEIANWLAGLGYTAFVLEYRVPMKQSGALQDIQRAISLVRSDASRYNVDTNKIGIMGFSAGGNLTARAATSFMVRKYGPVDQRDSTSCRPDFALLIYPGSLATGPDHHLIPEVTVTKQTPPMFVFVASDDPYGIPFGLGEALRNEKLPFEFYVYPKGGHGYGLRTGNPAAQTWPQLAEKWLTDYALK